MRCLLQIIASALVAVTSAIGAHAANGTPVDVPEQALRQFMVGHAPPGVTLAAPQASSTASAQSEPSSIERASALDGTQYLEIAPIFTGSDGNFSYIRFLNANGLLGSPAVTATFNITVVGSPSGRAYGTANIQVPSFGNPQYALQQVLNAANAGALSGGDTAYSLYLQTSNQLVTYQHVIWNSSNGFFENVSICNSAVGYAGAGGSQAQFLMNVYTSSIPAYPSLVFIHNYQDTQVTYQILVTDAASGAVIGTVNLNTAANASYMIPESLFEQSLNWTPTATQYNVTMFFTVANAPAGTLANAVVGQFIFNQSLSAYVNMSTACAASAN